jgi:hypothetical protein
MTINVAGYLPTSEEQLGQVVNIIRLMMRDYQELNQLTLGVENDERLIVWAILDTIDDWNITPPLLNAVTISTFPSMRLLTTGAIIQLLKSVGILGTRNAVAFTDGGFSYNTDKTQALMSWIGLLENEYEKKKLRYKTALNIENAWGGGVHSEYLWISSGWYGSWS